MGLPKIRMRSNGRATKGHLTMIGSQAFTVGGAGFTSGGSILEMEGGVLAAFAGGEAAQPDSEVAGPGPRGRLAGHAVGGGATDKGAIEGSLETEVDGIVRAQVQRHSGECVATLGAEVAGVDGSLQCGKPHWF